MSSVRLSKWCALEEPTVGLLSGRALNEETSNNNKSETWPKNYRPLEQLLLKKVEAPLAVVLRCWGGMLLTLDRLHSSTPSHVLLRGHADLWAIKHPSLNKGASTTRSATRFPSVRALMNAESLDGLKGDVRARFSASTRVYPCDVALPEEVETDRFSAPEAIAGETVTPAADVYVAASIALALLTGGTVAAHAGDIPLVLEGLRLFRPDLPVGIQQLLEASLNEEPGGRPAEAAEAYQLLCDAIAEESSSFQKPWSSLPEPPICYRRVELGKRKFRESVTTFEDVQVLYDDDLLYAQLEDNLIVAAVFDGVTTADVGCGAFAATIAKDTILSELEKLIKHKRNQEKKPNEESTSLDIFEWLSRMLDRALKKAQEVVVNEVVNEYSSELTPGARAPETTATVALIWGDHAVVGWVGDSPAWVADVNGITAITAPTTAGFMALQESRQASAYQGTSSPGALSETLGALIIAPSEEEENNLVVKQLPVQARQAPVRLSPGSVLVLATDGVLSYLGDSTPSCLRFASNAARECFKKASNEPDAIGRFFDLLWDESQRQHSPDDRSLLILSGPTGRAEEESSNQ